MPALRRRLIEHGVGAVAFSFWNARSRIPESKPYDRYVTVPDSTEVLVTSGGWSASQHFHEHDADWWQNLTNSYLTSVNENLDHIDYVTEFDLVPWGIEFRHWQRESFFDAIPSKFVPVWHPEDGANELRDMCEKYMTIGLPNRAFDDPELRKRVRSIVRSRANRFFALGAMKPDLVRSVGFDGVVTTAWLGPMRYGEVIAFGGGRLHRYPKDYVETAISRHSLDPERLTEHALDAYEEWAASVTFTPKRRRATTPEVEAVETALATPLAERWNPPTITPGRELLPVVGLEPIEDVPGGEVHTGMRSSSKSLRQCVTCQLADVCPRYTDEPEADCAFELPVSIRTRPELNSLMSALVEMQAQRLLFARFGEELQGGLPDKTVSAEMDRFFDMVEKMKTIQDDRDYARIMVETRGSAGVLSRIFGDQAAETMSALPGEVDDALVAEVVSD